ncbi:hypothetical protein PHG31p61 [Aeromonas phage 31]|uniref:Uncharacterized protein PHG31ORF062c n=1 Tax=Aeromonas phage 31 TaxID=321023 RepID=Q56EV0_9CAUD|nr:hypothetical protein PHG31p61 [Aeromonas phage 31]AAX63550.1 hypothetical protein PHG31p61 [Aeromonas phage 31]APU00955.1 hypothetical protein [Aeromonas phage 31.2]APU02363.1 hypothetical protein [Aeromonas phage SW69-9]
MIIIGSRALQHHFHPEVAPTTQMDHDFISTADEWAEYQARMDGRPVTVKNPNVKAFVVGDGKSRCCYHETYIVRPGSSDEMIYELMGNPQGTVYATPEILLAIKMAHRFKKNTRNFIKTMVDIHVMRDNGVVMGPVEQRIFELREAESLNYGHPKLNVNKGAFFKDDIYTYDHDSIHEAVAVNGIPAYKSYMADGAEVMTSKSKFFSCDEETRILGVYEESCVLALERCLIPFPGKVDPTEAFMMALEKVCTSITSGWFREYAWENYHPVMMVYLRKRRTDEAYQNLFNKNKHLLRPHHK